MILEKLLDNNGKWSWYELTNALISSEVYITDLIPRIRQMNDLGLLEWTPPIGHPQPRYIVTNEGMKVISATSTDTTPQEQILRPTQSKEE